MRRTFTNLVLPKNIDKTKTSKLLFIARNWRNTEANPLRMLMNFVLVALGNLGKKRILTHTGIVLPKTHTANQVINAKYPAWIFCLFSKLDTKNIRKQGERKWLLVHDKADSKIKKWLGNWYPKTKSLVTLTIIRQWSRYCRPVWKFIFTHDASAHGVLSFFKTKVENAKSHQSKVLRPSGDSAVTSLPPALDASEFLVKYFGIRY